MGRLNEVSSKIPNFSDPPKEFVITHGADIKWLFAISGSGGYVHLKLVTGSLVNKADNKALKTHWN